MTAGSRTTAPVVLGREVAAGDGGHRAVDQIVALGQAAQDRHDAAGAMQVLHVVGTGGRELDDVGHPRRDLVEGLEGQVDAHLVGDGLEVQHGVGRAAQRGVEGERVTQAGCR